jgi:hypothetical protein
MSDPAPADEQHRAGTREALVRTSDVAQARVSKRSTSARGIPLGAYEQAMRRLMAGAFLLVIVLVALVVRSVLDGLSVALGLSEAVTLFFLLATIPRVAARPSPRAAALSMKRGSRASS